MAGKRVNIRRSPDQESLPLLPELDPNGDHDGAGAGAAGAAAGAAGLGAAFLGGAALVALAFFGAAFFALDFLAPLFLALFFAPLSLVEDFFFLRAGAAFLLLFAFLVF